MEKSNTSVEENSHTSKVDTPVSKSLGSLILIESISIDLEIPMSKKEEGDCRHFSIHGYVAEMRKRDRTICSPFASTSDFSISEEKLPLLDVPKFRWWRCKRCIGEISAECGGKEIEILSNSCISRLISAKTASSSAVENIISEMKHESTSQIGDRNKSIVDDSLNTSGNDLRCKPKKGGSIVVEDKPVAAAYFSDNIADVTNESRSLAIEVASKRCSSPETDSKSSDKSIGSPNNGQKTASMICKRSDGLSDNDKALDIVKTKLSRLPSPELRDYSETSSGNDSIGAKSRQWDLRNDISNGLPRRRNRKVRLLTDILGIQLNLETCHARAERNSSSTTPMVPAEVEPVSASQDNGPFLRKRKFSQEGDCNLSAMGISNMAKIVRSSNGEAERSSVAAEIADSRSKEKESGEYIKNGLWIIKHRNGVHKPRRKQLQHASGYSPEMPLKNNGSNGYDAHTSLFHSPHSTSNGRKVEPHLRDKCQSLVGTDSDSGFCWNSSKFLESGNVSSTHMHLDNNFLPDSSTRRKNFAPVITDENMVTFQPTHEISAKVRLNLSLNNFRGSGKHAEDDIAQGSSMSNWPFFLQKDNRSCDPPGKDNTLVRHSNTVGSGQSSRKEVMYNPNQGISQTSIWQRTNAPIPLQKGSLHVPDIMEMPHRHEKAYLNEFLEHSDASKHHKSQHPEKALERGSSDDIPMEIVELMAKNQYERSLAETKKKCRIERTDAIARSYPEIHESGAVIRSRPDVTSFHPANVDMNADFGASRGSSLHSCHVKRNHLGRSNEGLNGLFGTSPQTPQKLSSGGQSSSCLQYGEEAELGWFPTAQNMPFGFPQKFIGQPNEKMIHGQAPASLQKGRTISDIRSGGVKMQNEPQLLSPKPGNAYLNVESRRSLDETIPAMQLLSLMDRRMPSNPHFNLEANKVVENPFSPCRYHPRFHMDGKQSILNGSYLSPHQLESPGVHSCGYYADQISFKSRVQKKSKKSCAAAWQVGSKLERFVSSKGHQSLTRDSCCEKDGQDENLAASSSTVLPLQGHNASEAFRLKRHNIARAVLPVKRSSVSYICSLNRNPAEFSIPEKGNPFTWCVNDSRSRKKSSSKDRSHTTDLNKQKEQGITKERARKLPPTDVICEFHGSSSVVAAET